MEIVNHNDLLKSTLFKALRLVLTVLLIIPLPLIAGDEVVSVWKVETHSSSTTKSVPTVKTNKPKTLILTRPVRTPQVSKNWVPTSAKKPQVIKKRYFKSEFPVWTITSSSVDTSAYADSLLKEVPEDWNVKRLNIEFFKNKKPVKKPMADLPVKQYKIDNKNYIEVAEDWGVSTLWIEYFKGEAVGINEKETSKTNNTEKPVKPSTIINMLNDKITKLPYKILLNDKAAPQLNAYVLASNELMFHLPTIAELLFDSVSLDKKSNKIKYLRTRDGAKFELDVETGEVIANGQSVGFLKETLNIDLETGLIPINAIQVFSGLLVNRDDEAQTIAMKLDKRLQYITGFDLYVNGKEMPFVSPEPKTLGHVLLLPLRPIVDELGGEIQVQGDRVTVIRAHDGVTISLELSSGIVKVNDKPAGIAPNIAYANIDDLLLPREAIASLTGTHITIPSGSRRIDIDIDDELSRIIRPGESIRSKVNKGGPKIESVRVIYDSDHKLDTTVKGHYQEYSLKVDYNSPSTQGEGAFTADWLKITAESVDGWVASAGDQSINHRELDGVNVSRLNGASYYRPMKDGVLVGVAGKTQSGVEKLGNGEQIATFDGQAAGLRYYNDSKNYEFGVALRDNNSLNIKALVLSAHKSKNSPDFSLGHLNQRIAGTIGNYDVNDNQSIGGRISWDARLEPSKSLSLSTNVDYSSSEVIAGFEQKDQLLGQESVADLSVYSATLRYRPLQRLSFSLQQHETHRGIFEGHLADEMVQWHKKSSASASFNMIEHRLSPWIHFNWSRSETSAHERIKQLSGQATWNINQYHLLIKHEDHHSNIRGKSWLSSLELSRDSFIRYFAKNSQLMLSPRLAAWKGTESQNASLGALVSFDSGDLLGDKVDFKMSYGKNLGVHRLETLDDVGEDTQLVDSEYFTANLGVDFNSLLAFNANYYSNLSGSDDLYASLSAYYEFNTPRKIKKTQKNAGILMGQVFFDENQDGHLQKEEKGLGGVRLNIKGTRVALNTDRKGRFTIQNLPVGIYRITPDVSRLPLGYVRQTESETPVQIGDAKITMIQIPIVKGNRLSGVVYVDENGNQKLDKGEARIENIGLEINDDNETASTLFGQFSFDFLPPGDYDLKVQEDTLPYEYRVDPSMDWSVRLGTGDKSSINVRLLEIND